MKLVCLLSGGIDSPVAAYQMAKAGADVALLHMDNGRYGGSGALDKVRLLRGQLQRASGTTMPLYAAPHERNQTIASQLIDRSFQCVICKRTMQRVAKGLALKLGAEGIVMGDSLGQVASQTLQNIRAEQTGLHFPVLRPLIGMDKLEIEQVAKRIGTYEISIVGGGVCGILPERPRTMARVDQILDQERKLDFEEMVAFAVENAAEIQ
jgi:thiamine biosynthesis protein ThiI